MRELMKERMPQLMAHFEACDFDPGMLCLQWFSCLFAYNFNAEVLARLWDVIFIKGDKMLFRISLAIFHLLASKLMRQTDRAQLVQIMESIQSLLQSIHLIMQVSKLDQCKVKKSQIENLRK